MEFDLRSVVAEELRRLKPELRLPGAYDAFFGQLHAEEQRQLAAQPISDSRVAAVQIYHGQKVFSLFTAYGRGNIVLQEIRKESPKNPDNYLVSDGKLSFYVDGKPADFESPRDAVRRVLES